MKKNNVMIPVVFLLIGFISAYLVFGKKTNDDDAILVKNTREESIDVISNSNPFVVKEENSINLNRFDIFEDEISGIKEQLKSIEQTLQTLTAASNLSTRSKNTLSLSENRPPSMLSQRLYNLDSLIRGGISAEIAEYIVRRKNRIEIKRLELQDHAKRDDYLNTQQYFDELETINQQDISLREELGDDRYDEYLYESKQNNRIRIASVMLGSTAEQSGIQKNDVVLSYDNKRMFSWQELKNATTEGQLGEFVSINLYRNGEIYSFTVPRGPLGIKLGATRLAP